MLVGRCHRLIVGGTSGAVIRPILLKAVVTFRRRRVYGVSHLPHSNPGERAIIVRARSCREQAGTFRRTGCVCFMPSAARRMAVSIYLAMLCVPRLIPV